MRYDYDKGNKIITLDGEGTLILSNGNPALYLTEDFCDNDDFKTHLINHYIIGFNNKFVDKWVTSLSVLKYIWRKN